MGEAARPDAVVRRYRVCGRVQGVGFRAFVWRRAQELGLDGWVRNLADGSVEALVSGSVERHADFEAVLREGPRWSRVEFVVVADEVGGPQLPSGFAIARDGA